MKFREKCISTVISLLLLQVGIDTAKLKTTKGKDDYGLPGFAKDVALVAGIVSGIANTQNGLEKDEMVGELFLGFNQKMSTLEDLDVAKMTTELEKIGNAVTKQCGSGDGCDSVDEKIRSAGIGVFEELNTSIKPELRAILKDENAFKELTTLQDAFNSISSLTANLKQLQDNLIHIYSADATKLHAFLLFSKPGIASIMTAPIDKWNQDVLETAKRQEFIAKIKLILELEPLKLSDQDGKIRQLNEHLNDVIALETALSSVFSEVSLVEETIDQITPILSSSIRSPQHPLFFVTSGLDENIKNFEKTFLNGSNADGKNDVQLKTLLNPMRELINELKPLRTSWNSLKVDGIEQKMDNLRENLKDASSEIAKFSAFSAIRNCVKDATIATSFDFSTLTPTMNKLNAVSPIQQSDVDATKSSYANVVEHLKKFQEMEGKSVEEIRPLLPNLPPQDQFANDLEAFKKSLSALFNSKLEEWMKDDTLKTAVSKLKMAPVLEAIDCLEKDKLFGFQVNSIQMKPLSSLKTKNPDVKAAISTASALKKVVDEWEKVKTVKANSGNGDKAAKVKLENGMEVARNLVTFSGMITDLAAAYAKKSHFKSLSDSSEDVRKELQEDKPAIRKLLNAWDGSVKKTTRNFPVSLEKVYKLLDKRPSSLWDIEKYLKKMKKFKSINFDLNNVTRQLVRAVRDSNVRNYLKTIGNLNLNFVALQKSLSDAVNKFPYLDEYFLMFADAQSKKLAEGTTDSEEAKADDSGMSLTLIIIIVVVCAVISIVAIVAAFFGWKRFKNRKPSKGKEKKNGKEERKKLLPRRSPPPPSPKVKVQKPPVEKNYKPFKKEFKDKKEKWQELAADSVSNTAATTGTDNTDFLRETEAEVKSFEAPCTKFKILTMFKNYDFSNLPQEYEQEVCTSEVKFEKAETMFCIGEDYNEFSDKTLVLKGDRGVEVVEVVEQHEEDRTQSTAITITAEGPAVSERTIGGSEEQLQQQPSQSVVRRVVNYFRELFGMHIEIDYVQMEEPPAEPHTEVNVEVEGTPAEPHTEVNVEVEKTPAEPLADVNVEVEKTPAEPLADVNVEVEETPAESHTEVNVEVEKTPAEPLADVNVEVEETPAESHTEVNVEVEKTPAEPLADVNVEVEETPAESHTEVNVEVEKTPAEPLADVNVEVEETPAESHTEVNVEVEKTPAEPLADVNVEVEKTPAEPHTEVNVEVEKTPAEPLTEVNVEVEKTPAEPHTEIDWPGKKEMDEKVKRVDEWLAAKKLEALKAENERRTAENIPLLSSVSDLESYYSEDENDARTSEEEKKKKKKKEKKKKKKEKKKKEKEKKKKKKEEKKKKKEKEEKKKKKKRTRRQRVSAGRNENTESTDVNFDFIRADGTIDAIAGIRAFTQPDFLKIKQFGGKGAPRYPIAVDKIRKMIAAGRLIFQKEPGTIKIKGFFYGTGDLHAKFSDFVLTSFGGEEPWLNKQFVLTGDYVDRDRRSLCLVLLLVLMKIAFPPRVHLLRGNHETRAVNERYGFKAELIRLFGEEDGVLLWKEINAMFDELPIRALANEGKMLIVHGGVSMEWKSRKDFDETDGKYDECGENDPKKAQVFEDVLWADLKLDEKDPKELTVEPSERNPDARQYNYTAFKQVMDAIGIEYLIRGHQVFGKGFRKLRRHITVFGVSNSRDPGAKSNNNGSFFKCFDNVVQFYRVQNADTTIRKCDEVNDALTQHRKLKHKAKNGQRR